MITNLKEKLSSYLEINGVNLAIFVGSDGFLVDRMGVASDQDENVAYQSAILYGSTAKLGQDLNGWDASQLTVEFKKGFVFITRWEDGVLAVLTEKNVKQAQLRMKLSARH